MKVLLLGSGGREHAFAWKLAQSPLLDKLYISPGNAGTAACGENVELDNKNFKALHDFCLLRHIDMVIPAGEDRLVEGITDYFEEQNLHHKQHILVAGPSKWAAQLEGSKDFSKQFMKRHGIPTAGYATFTKETLTEAKTFLRSLKPPFVLKADGLAAGKGVIITSDTEEADMTLDMMLLEDLFGSSGARVVIEEFLEGIEISVFVVSDGTHWKILGSAKDYKRIGEGDTGPNTGGMGAISPVPFADASFMDKVRQRIIEPTLAGMRQEHHPFRGFLFLGLMNKGGEPSVIEYNVRMGDPETEAIFPRLKTDMLQLVKAMAAGDLDKVHFETDPRCAATVFLVSEGYPGEVKKGRPMLLPLEGSDSFLFHAGTKAQDGQVLTNGGRVLAVTALAGKSEEALKKAMELAGQVYFEGVYFRKDIGRDLLQYQTP